jgi:hypothetical protein
LLLHAPFSFKKPEVNKPHMGMVFFQLCDE